MGDEAMRRWWGWRSTVVFIGLGGSDGGIRFLFGRERGGRRMDDGSLGIGCLTLWFVECVLR